MVVTSISKRWRLNLVPPTEPRPKEGSILNKPAWEATSVFDDARTILTSSKSFDNVLDNRRTTRAFRPAGLPRIFDFIQRVFEPHHSGSGKLSGRKRKVAISAGALHPIDVIVVSGTGVREPILYCDQSQRFMTLPLVNQIEFAAAVGEAENIVPSAIGHMLLFVGDLRRVSSAYEAPESLLWRDGGAALQTCSMAAEAYEFACCPLGLTGQAIVKAVITPHRDMIAIGLVVIGMR